MVNRAFDLTGYHGGKGDAEQLSPKAARGGVGACDGKENVRKALRPAVQSSV